VTESGTQSSTEGGIRKATSADVDKLGDVLARAFDDDPIFRAMLPDDARRRHALPILFREWTRLLHLPLDAAWTTDDVTGGALWAPPGKWKIGLLDEAKMAPKMLGALGSRVVASLRVLFAIESRHPKGPPHHYLRVLGCDPTRQGQGIGSRLLRPVLEQCDAKREPAYLESSNEKNLPFYRRHGFETIDEVVTHLGPRIWLMWRDPR
jgi:ribosomal protein S18 acetylase RimI-like enzyme